MLSLLDGVPVQHGGSSGGLYGPATFASWANILPFDASNPAEIEMRMIFGHVKEMKRPHYAFMGAQEAGARLIGHLRQEAAGSKNISVMELPGDHFTSLKPAMRRYLGVISKPPPRR